MKSIEQSTREIERLRAYRVWPERDQSIAPLVEAIGKRSERVQRQLGALIELWQSEVPAEIADRTELTALRGGVLHARVPSSALAFELDRTLREGLLTRLRTQYAGPLSRVRVTVG